MRLSRYPRLLRLAAALLPLLTLPALAGCGDTCRLRVTNEIPDVTLASIEVRLDGTSYWGEVDLLSGSLDSGDTRGVRVPEGGPFLYDVRGSTSTGRSWTRHDVIACKPPNASLSVTLTDADRDEPCTWTLTNDTDGALVSVRLRRAGTLAWAREVLAGDLAMGEAIEFVMNDDEPTWDLQVEDATGDVWTRVDLARCDAGEARDIPISGDPDPLPEAR